MGGESARVFGELADFEPVVRAAFGAGRHLVEVRRLRGGSKKGVYQLVFDDGAAVVGYVWSETENYWPGAGEADEHAGPFADATGADLFITARSLLRSLGIRVPDLFLLDRGGTLFPNDIALIESVPGRSLEAMLDDGAPEAGQVLGRLRKTLEMMREHRGPSFGKIADVAAGTAVGASCEQVVLDRALAHLAEAADRMPSIAAARARLEERLRDLAAAVEPRQEYALVHGELGPDHVLVDAAGEPVLIDIEGLMYFDVEWEHAFLSMRFKDHYPLLRADSLDEHRLRLYRLALHLSLAAVPMRLADSDYPERDFMIEIAVEHARLVLGYLQPP